jgi:hypothetical protein
MMSARIRMVLGIAVTIGVIAAAWIAVVAPKREQAAQLGAAVAQAEQRRDDASARAAQAEQARTGYDRDYATVARLGKAVPANADVPSLVFQLESAARRAKVDFRAVSVLDTTPQAPTPAGSTPAGSTPAAGGGIEPTPFSFKFEGDFFGLQQLLARIDRFSRVKGTQIAVNGRLLTIDGLSVSPARGGLPRVQGLVTARAYVADLPAALPAGAPVVTPASQVTP